MRFVHLLLPIFLLGFDCNPKSDQLVKPFPTPVVQDSDWCEQAEKNLQRLSCKEGQPTKRGKGFAEFCRETQSNGIFINPKCLSVIDSCSTVESCNPSAGK